MLFNSYIFVLLFLPLCLTGWFGLNRLGKDQWSQAFLLGMSLWFYGYFHPGYLVIILGSIVLNYGLYRLFSLVRQGKSRKLLLLLGLGINLGILFYYKYMNFFLGELGALTGKQWSLPTVVLPLGISFFTFQQLSFLVDAYRGEAAHYGFLEYACFVAYFPQLIAGPIVTHDELIPQFRDPEKRKWNWDNMARGLFLFSLGMGKKVLLADLFGTAADAGFLAADGLDSTGALITMLAYTLQIYLDFSGYCDMALGLGKMMNIDLPGNFDSPYKALDIRDFWNRWHKTLTRFLTKYVYIPLGGSRKGTLRTYCNVLLVFLVSGIWHGAGNTFLIWGLLHGLASVAVRFCQSRWHTERLPKLLRWALTFAFLNVTWVFFRAGSVSEARTLLGHLFEGNFGPPPEGLLAGFSLVEINAFCDLFRYSRPGIWPVTLCFFGATLFSVAVLPNTREMTEKFRPTFGRLLFSAVVLVWSLFSLSGVSSFLYFNF